MQSEEIRESFLHFFDSKGHQRVPSSSLVPQGDPTLLFTNAGMVQFKDYFLGLRQPPYPRAATAQKCLRAGGKHNDLDNVGYTARHHTFFEMLGNFSFGDYFKAEAIAFAWEYLVGVLGLPRDRLWVTIYREDEESRTLWQKVARVSPERIIGLGEKDNFWAMGDTGPCGPCTEVLIDRGEEYRCQAPRCGIGQCDCDRYFELWNLVFMQYNREPSGELVPLPRPSVDTGMGLERITSILQGVPSNYDTDLFLPLIALVERLCGQSYSDDPRGFAFRVVADHARACTFLVGDGVLPSNEGRGYLLRRILRRAVRYGRKLGIEGEFLGQVAQGVIEKMGRAYPELAKNRDFILKVISLEETRFQQTLTTGLNVLEKTIGQALAAGQRLIPGEEVFRLYDTYGFPKELTEELAAERGLGVDWPSFQAAMAAQREQARAASKFYAQDQPGEVYQSLGLPPTAFVGYERLEEESTIVAILVAGQPVESASQGQEVEVITMSTPFYPEGGGQIGDAGEIRTSTGRVLVADTQRPLPELIVHRGQVAEGFVSTGDRAQLLVESQRRQETARHHTATHLLHAALRQVLGPHVQQSGSLVSYDRLRFDFSHLGPVRREELEQVQRLVNEKVREDLPVVVQNTSYDQAVAAGALAFFGEKYGDRVRVVALGREEAFSKELCGGTHVGRSGEIGFCLILGESGIGAGLRRIEALVGRAAEKAVEERLGQMEAIASRLGASLENLEARIQGLLEEREQRAREVERLRQALAREEGERLREKGIKVGRSWLVVGEVSDIDIAAPVVEYLQRALPSGVSIVGSAGGGRVYLGGTVSPDLVAAGFSAVEELRKVARKLGGGAGGRPDWAQGGGKDANKLSEALEGAKQELERALNKAGAGSTR
jgi:alanyl-tRNA synthetase